MLRTTGTSHLRRTTKNTTVQCLLDHGADAKLEGDNDQVPLSDAADKGHGIVRVLPEHDADANSQDKDGFYTAFLHGLYYGNSKADFPQTARLLVLSVVPGHRTRRTPSSGLVPSFLLEVACICLRIVQT